MPSRFVEYALKDDSPVALDVVIGDAQAGSVTVYLEQQFVAQGPVINKLPLGNGGSLGGKRLVISTVVLDVQSQTDMTCVVTRIFCGTASKIWRDEEKARPGGVVTYVTVIDFVEGSVE